MTNKPLVPTLLGFAALLASSMAAHAGSLSIAPTGSGTDQWETESGQSMPTATQGVMDGTLIATAGFYTFTYGAPALISSPPSTGHGDSVFTNIFVVRTGLQTIAQAEAAGQLLCNHAIPGLCAAASVGASSFSLSLPAGAVNLSFLANVNPSNGTGGTEIDNGNGIPTPNSGAFLDTTGPVSAVTANTGSSGTAFLGLTDSTYPADHDFQDLVVQVSTPEPGTLAILGAGLLGLFSARKRRISR